MDKISELCSRIYNAAKTAVEGASSQSPVAYIHVRIGKKLKERKDEITKLFNKLKWDSPLSTADLDIVEDDSLGENNLVIESVEEFYDDEKGKAETYSVSEKDRKIEL